LPCRAPATQALMALPACQNFSPFPVLPSRPLSISGYAKARGAYYGRQIAEGKAQGFLLEFPL